MGTFFAKLNFFVGLLILAFLFSPLAYAQNGPTSLPSKKSVNSGPEEISPEKGDVDPLKKNEQIATSKKVLTGDSQVKEFVGVVQFVKGSVQWSGTDRKDPIEFKTLFNWSESLLINSGAHLKFVSRGRCTGVAYGKSQLQTPLPTADSAWNFIGGSSRFICGPEYSDNLRIDGHALTVSDGEVLYHEKKLFVVRGKVLSESGELAPSTTYRWGGKSWVEEHSAEDLYRSWKLAQELAPPIESHHLSRPNQNIHSRWSLVPMAGLGDFNHPSDLFSISDAESHGFRAQANFQWGTRSVYAGFNFYEMEGEDHDRSNHMGSPGQFNRPYNRLETMMVDFGVRSNHQKDFAWYYRGGIGEDVLTVDGYTGSFSLRRKVEYLSMRLAVGIEKIVFEERLGWGGLLIGVEAFYHRALKHTNTRSLGQEYIPTPKPAELNDEKATYDSSGFMIFLAPMLQF